MKINVFITMMAAVLFMAACSSAPGLSKKIYITANGKMQPDAATGTITFEPSNQHNDLKMELSGDIKNVTVKSSEGEKKYDVSGDGVYLLNLKVDTLIGSKVNFGEGDMPRSIDAEQLQNMIDSTDALLAGKNVDNKTSFFVVPNSIQKVSDNYKAEVLSPYDAVPNQVQVDEKGNAPEMYKFYTNSEKRRKLKELIERITK